MRRVPQPAPRAKSLHCRNLRRNKLRMHDADCLCCPCFGKDAGPRYLPPDITSCSIARRSCIPIRSTFRNVYCSSGEKQIIALSRLSCGSLHFRFRSLLRTSVAIPIILELFRPPLHVSTRHVVAPSRRSFPSSTSGPLTSYRLCTGFHLLYEVVQTEASRWKLSAVVGPRSQIKIMPRN